MRTRLRSLGFAGALVFLVIHLAHLPQTLEDIDSINFALGVESFDVPNHQPHPPGYPLFIVLAKASTAAVGVLRPGWDRDHRAAAGLAVWGAIAGALGVLVLIEFWVAAGLTGATAVIAAIVTVTSPLFWFTASRPLTDVAGLVVAVAVQTWLLRGLRDLPQKSASLSATWLAATLAAGLAVGFRSQSLWLTAPFIVWGSIQLVQARRGRELVMTTLAGAIGIVIWFVPLVLISGVRAYVNVVRNQGADDFAGPHMLAVSLTGRRLSTYLGHTFVNPWQARPFALLILSLALIGFGLAAWRQRRLLAVVLAGFVPYLVFHLAFQETVTTRYALPIVVPVAGLAAYALSSVGMRMATAGALAIVTTSLVFAEPRLAAYSGQGAPAFRAFQDMQRALASLPERPLLRMHHQVWWAVRRVVDWYRPVWDAGPQKFPGDREWLGVVDHFRSGSTRPVWFLAHLSRTDMAAFDPRTTERTGTYAPPPALATLIGGARVDTFAWWSIRRPGWMLGRGWALTPELAGMTEQDRVKGETGPPTVFLARRPDAMRLLIGGRYLGPDAGPAGRLVVDLDGSQIAEWRVTPSQRWFVQWIDVDAMKLQGEGTYSTLAVRVAAEAPGAAAPAVGLEQFDAAPVDESMYALTTGWFEHEENPQTGLTWRWMGGRATIDIRGGHRDRTLVFAGESPLKYFKPPAEPPEIVVRAGDRVLGRYVFRGDFSERVTIPADALGPSGQLITLESSRTFKPADLQPGSPDQRDLSLRMYSLKVE